MLRAILVIGAAFIITPALADVTEGQARSTAAKFMAGSVYGATTKAAQRSIQDVRYLAAGERQLGVCDRFRAHLPTWGLFVKANDGKSAGLLFVDAKTGKVACTDLPNFD